MKSSRSLQSTAVGWPHLVFFLIMVVSACAFSPSTTIRARTKSMEARGQDRKAVLRIVGTGLWLYPQTALAKGVKRVKADPITLPSGVVYQDKAIGSGNSPKVGDRVAIHYSLYYNGLEVESSRDSSGLAATPLGFTWGAKPGLGGIMPGLQEGMTGMQIGSRRRITVPGAFGKKGKPPFIPGDATVLFDVTIWSVKPAGVNANLTLPGQQNYF